MTTPAEILLPRRSLPQPHPFIRHNGDCGACALGGMLGLSGPEEAYALLPDSQAFGPPEIRRALANAERSGLVDRIVDDVPMWPLSAMHATNMPWGLPGWWCQSGAWFRHVRVAIDAGYYGLAPVSFAAGGARSHIDHIVLICGAREAERGRGEIAVSCSARGGAVEWVGAHEFLRDRGGFNVLLARPVKQWGEEAA